MNKRLLQLVLISQLGPVTLAGCGGGGNGATVPPAPVIVPPVASFPVSVTFKGLPAETKVAVQNNDNDVLIITKDGTYQFPTKVEAGASFSVSLSVGNFVSCDTPVSSAVVGTEAPGPVVYTCRETPNEAKKFPFWHAARTADYIINGFIGYSIDYRDHQVFARNVAAEFYAQEFGEGKPGFRVGTSFEVRPRFHFSPASSIAWNGKDLAVTDTCNGVVRILSHSSPVLAGQPQTQCGPDRQLVTDRDGAATEARFALPGAITASSGGGDWFVAGATPNVIRRVTGEGAVSSIVLRPALPGGGLPGVIRSLEVAGDGTTLYATGEGGVWKIVGSDATLFAALPGAGELARTFTRTFVYSSGKIYEMSEAGALTVFLTPALSPKFDVLPASFGYMYDEARLGVVETAAYINVNSQPAINAAGELLLPNPYGEIIDMSRFRFRKPYPDRVIGRGFKAPQTLANDAAGNVIVLDKLDAQHFVVKSVDNQSTLVTATGDATSAQLAYGPAGLIAVSLPAEKVVRIYRDGVLLNSVTSGFEPEALAFDASGMLYFSDKSTLRIMKLGASGLPVQVASLPRTDEVDWRSMAIDSKGNIYLSGIMGVTKVTPAGSVSVIEPFGAGKLAQGLAIRNGFLYGVFDRLEVYRAKLPD